MNLCIKFCGDLTFTRKITTEVQTHLMISLIVLTSSNMSWGLLILKDIFLTLILTHCDENFVLEPMLVKYRKIKDIDVNAFIDISNSVLSKPDDFRSSERTYYAAMAVSTYDNVLSELLKLEHAPMQKRVFTIRKDAPWFTSEIGDAKCARRNVERLYRHTNLTIHRCSSKPNSMSLTLATSWPFSI